MKKKERRRGRKVRASKNEEKEGIKGKNERL